MASRQKIVSESEWLRARKRLLPQLSLSGKSGGPTLRVSKLAIVVAATCLPGRQNAANATQCGSLRQEPMA